MSMDGEETRESLESPEKEDIKLENGISNASEEKLLRENGLEGPLRTHDSSDSYDEFVQGVMELRFQNEYLKSQYEGFKTLKVNPDSGGTAQLKESAHLESDDIKELSEQIASLKRELLEEKQTRGAAEEALKHLRALYSEADAKTQELNAKLAEAQQKMDQEIRERDEKYSELDTKFSRLHKRAKQRIQEVQKEKDDMEAQFRDANDKAEQASLQLSSLQHEFDRTRQQASEALKAMDSERQQLRSANNKLRDEIEEIRHLLAPKENVIESLQQSLLEKDQMLENLRGSLQAAEEKRLASISDLSSKHQLQIQSLEANIADALAERSKATETITSLRTLVAEKESKIAEMDAASSGESARLRAAIETIKGELKHVKSENEKEKENWQEITKSLQAKLEVSESNVVRAEVELAKMRSQLDSELSSQSHLMNAKDAELTAAREQISHLESEFASYKVRAHSLLQRKDAELAAARDTEQLKELEEALKEAEKDIMLLSSEKDKVEQDLKDAHAYHVKEIAERDEALHAVEQQVKTLERKLNSALSSHQSEKEAWEANQKNLEETWRLRCEALKAERDESSVQHWHKELQDLIVKYKKLKEEHGSFRDLADKMIEEKDSEITKLVNDNKNLHQLLEEAKQQADYKGVANDSGFQKEEVAQFDTSATEQQILFLARQQAQREEELKQSHRHILALQEEIEELEHENRLHSQQVAMLKEELRNMDRTQKREGVDLTYLKNVVLKLLETGEVEALLPVIAMLLQFSPQEVQRCQNAAHHSKAAAPPSPAADSGISLLSRFSFS